MKEIWKLIESDYQRYTNARGGSYGYECIICMESLLYI